MADLRNLMHEAVSDLETGTPDPQQDLNRARRGLRQHRTRQVRRALLPAGMAAAAAGVLTVSLLGSGPGAGTTSAGPATSATGTTGTSAPQESTVAIALTAYHGKQPEGFTIGQVPAGWEIQASDASHLLIAPENAKNQDPNVFVGKIVITLASQDELSVERDQAGPLLVGDVEGTRFTWTGSEQAGLLVPGDGGSLLFQFPEDLNWDDATIAEFAAGVHLTDAAKPGVG